MQFLWPLLLWSLLLIPILVAVYIWAQRRRRRYALRFSSLLVLKTAITPGQKHRRHIPAAIFLVGLAAMLVGLARPQTVAMLPTQNQIIVLAIDVSGSMRQRDINPSRIEAAKAAAETFVQEQKTNAKIGIVAFSGTAAIVQIPTTDREADLTAIRRLGLQRSTAIGSGILMSLNAIFGNLYADTFGTDIVPMSPAGGPTPVPKGTFAPASIILLTDGANVQGPSPAQAAEKAADLGVRIFTIGVGNPTNSPGQQGNGPSSGGAPSFGGPPGGGGPQFGGGGSFGGRPLGRFEVDETTLKGIAETTDGEYYLATDANALKQVYRDLNSQLVFTPQKTEVTFYFTAAGALFLVGATALSILWFSRIP